jgi:hypothetical protein
MSEEQAYRQARIRWGSRACVSFQPELEPEKKDRLRVRVYQVGYRYEACGISRFIVAGYSAISWERAFRMADRNNEFSRDIYRVDQSCPMQSHLKPISPA